MNVVKKPLFIKTFIFIFGLTISSLVKGGVYASTYLESNKNYQTTPANMHDSQVIGVLVDPDEITGSVAKFSKKSILV